jgi:hypothetical protein
MFANWQIYVSILAQSNFGKVASQVSQQSAAAQKSVGGLKKQISSLEGAGKILDKVMTGVGIGSAAVLAIGIKGASDLQKSTVQAAIAMGRTGDTVESTTAKMREFRDIAISMSKITGQSLPDAMNVISTMASGGISAKQIAANWKPIAQFTDVLHFGKDQMDYGEAAKLGTGLLHELRLFSTDQARFGFGKIARMGFLSPHGTQDLATQVRAAAPSLENLLPGNVQSKAQQIVDLVAWGDRMGGLSRFGTGISQLMTNMVAPRSDRVRGAMKDLGVYDAKGNDKFLDSKTGTFNFMGALQQVATHYKDAINLPGGRGQAVQSIMGLNANAARYLQLLSSPEALTAFNQVRAQQAAMGNDPALWLDKTQALLMEELSTQTGLLTSNFKTLATLIGESFVGPLTRLVTWATNLTGGWIDSLKEHPKMAAAIGTGMLAAAGFAFMRIAQTGGNVLRTFIEFGKHPHIAASAGHWFGHESAAAAKATAARGGGLLEGIGGILGLGALRREMGNLGGLFSPLLQRIPGVSRAVSGLTSVIDAIGLKFFSMRLGIAGIGEIIGRFGLRFIPFVGEVFLAIDALNFLGSHMKDIGYVAGEVAAWLIKNMPSLFAAAGRLAVSSMQGLLSEFLAVINPANWVKAITDFRDGVADGLSAPYRLSDNQKQQGIDFRGNAARFVPKGGQPRFSAPIISLPKPAPRIQLAPGVSIPGPTHSTNVSFNITVKGGDNPRKTGEIIGMVAEHHLRKAGVIKNTAVGGNFLRPAIA